MAVSTSMLYILLLFIHGIISITLKILLLLYLIFLTSAIFSTLKSLKIQFLFFIFPILLFFLFLFTSSLNLFLFTLPIFMFVFLLEPTPLSSPQIKLWSLFNKNLKLIIKFREIIYISDRLFNLWRSLKRLLLFLFLSLLIALFITYHQALLFVSVFSLISTASFAGLSLAFFSNLFSWIVFPKSAPNFLPYRTPPLSNTPPIVLFSQFLKTEINNHPLNALVEESFFEDNLQIGDFYLVYPIFYKASPPPSFNISLENEILNTWHLIRWESALSKQTGSAASRWSSLFSLRSAPIHRNAHSIHTPLIPIYREELYSSLLKLGLPNTDPFNQPPNWRPYLILVEFLNWKDDEIKEERLKEIEEEDWRCSLNRTSSLHLDRGTYSPEPH